MSKIRKGGVFAYVVWGLGSLFYLYEYFIRVIPSLIETQLETAYSATASQVANAVGLYLIIYAVMQLFVGPLFDVYGSRKLFLLASLLLTISCLLPMIPCKNLFWFGLARLLMGFSSAFGFVGVMYLCTLWFPHEKLAMLSGLTSMLGVLGAIIAQTSLSWLNTAHGNVWLISFVFGCIVTICLFFFIPQKSPGEETQEMEVSLWQQYKSHLEEVGRQWDTWNIGLLTGALYMPLAVFADLWSIPYLTKVCHFSPLEASQLTSGLNFSWALGAPIVGWVSDKTMSRKAPLLISGLTTAASFSLLLLFPHLPFFATACILCLVGACAGGQVVGFVACAELNSPHTKASSIAFINMIVMGLGGIVQAIVGMVITTCEKTMDIHISYQLGLGALVIIILIASLVFLRYFRGSPVKD